MATIDTVLIGNILKRFKPSKRVGAFAVCVLVATLLWLLTALTNKYTINIELDVEYENAAKNGVNEANLPKSVIIDVIDYGYNLVGYQWRKGSHRINLDFNQLRIIRSSKENESFVLLDNRADILSKQLSGDAKIVKLYPDTLYVSYGKRSGKKVPVRFRQKIGFAPQFTQLAEATVVPDSIYITGPQSMLNRIDEVFTDVLGIDNADKTITEKLAISRNNIGQEIVFSNNSVSVTVPVEEFTETTLDIPITVTPEVTNARVVLVPNKVTVKFNVAVSNFKKVNPQDFSVVADVGAVKSGNMVKLRIANMPSTVKNVSLSAKQIKFFYYTK